ncbi:reverse transcriptase domain-containing protein, partial [Tanacetum coccineum]
MDVEPMWAADRVVASTPGSLITIPETANEFAIKGFSIRLGLTRAAMFLLSQDCEGRKLLRWNQISKDMYRLVKLFSRVAKFGTQNCEYPDFNLQVGLKGESMNLATPMGILSADWTESSLVAPMNRPLTWYKGENYWPTWFLPFIRCKSDTHKDLIATTVVTLCALQTQFLGSNSSCGVANPNELIHLRRGQASGNATANGGANKSPDMVPWTNESLLESKEFNAIIGAWFTFLVACAGVGATVEYVVLHLEVHLFNEGCAQYQCKSDTHKDLIATTGHSSTITYWPRSQDHSTKESCIYVSRNNYIRAGIVECKVTNPVHVVLNKVVLEFPQVFWDDSVDCFGAGADESDERGWCFMFWNVKKTANAPILIALALGKASINGLDLLLPTRLYTSSGNATANGGVNKSPDMVQGSDAWLRMKEMLRNCHGHNLSKGNIIKKNYHGLSEITQEVLNAATGGIFLYKTPNQAYHLLEDKDAMTIKMDAQYKELQSRAKQPTPDLNDDDIHMSHEEEAKFMQTF